MLSEKFIKRVKEIIPEWLWVSQQTTPVIYFWKYYNSRVCTISLNPSDREFFDKNWNLLTKEERRLCSRKDLVKNDDETLTVNECETVISACEMYFQNKPYKSWFNKYEVFLNAFWYSYYDWTAVHLDLVQWATTPFWWELNTIQKDELLKRDLPFLEHMLERRFECIFLNGKTTTLEVSRQLRIWLTEKVAIYWWKNIVLYSWTYNQTPIIWWSPYIQSANVWGYEKIRELAKLIQTQ